MTTLTRGIRALAIGMLGAFNTGADAQSADAPTAPTIRVVVDPVARRVVISAGPFEIPAATPGMAGMEHAMHHHHLQADMMRITWPVDGYLIGTKMEMRDGEGRAIPTALVHHMNMTNFGRRQLVYPEFEVLFAMGQGNQEIHLPAGVGVPLPLGDPLGLSIVWHNETAMPVHGAVFRLTMFYAPKGEIRVAVIPFYADVDNVPGGANSFDIPAGRSRQQARFMLPVSGRLIAIGGHLHDYGVSLRLVDVRARKELVRLTALHDSAGHVPSTTRFVFGFRDDALRLEAGRPYQVISEYDNTSGSLIVDGAMAHFAGVFEPDDLAKLPKIDPSDPDFQKDLARFPLEVRELAVKP